MLLMPTAKRRHRANDGDESAYNAKRSRHILAQCTESITAPDKGNFVENWLDKSCWSRKASTGNETQPPEVSTDMSRRPVPILPSPGNSFERTVSTSRKSEMSAT